MPPALPPRPNPNNNRGPNNNGLPSNVQLMNSTSMNRNEMEEDSKKPGSSVMVIRNQPPTDRRQSKHTAPDDDDKGGSQSGGCLAQLWSIRVLAAALCAVFIIATAVCLLVTTFSFSMKAANDIAERQAVSIATKARDDVEGLLNKPLASIAGWQYVFSRGNHPLPSEIEDEKPNWEQEYYDQFTEAQRATDFSYQYAIIGFADQNYAGSKTIPGNNAMFQNLVYRYGHSTVANLTSRATSVNYYRDNYTVVPNGITNWNRNYTPTTRGWYKMVEHQPFAIRWSEVYLSANPVLPIIDSNAPLFNASGYMLGVISMTFELGLLTQFITGLVTTENTVSILIDNKDMLLASSYYVPYLEKSLLPADGKLPSDNCVQSDAANSNEPPMMLCRALASKYAYAPLRELTSERPDLVKHGRDGEAISIKLDGTDFFVSVVPVSTPLAAGMGWRFALFVPQKDIVGGIIQGRDVAIYISIAIIFAAVAMCFVILTFLMHPLQAVTESMYKLATLQDTDASAAPSSLYEISMIQGAFKVMSAELAKVKSFLPQSVLAQLYGGTSDDDDEEGFVDGDNTHGKSGMAATNSMGASHSHSQSHSNMVTSRGMGASASARPNATPTVASSINKRVRARGLNTGVAVSSRRVTMLCANIVGYHHQVIGADPMAIANASADLVAAISGAMNDHKGVLDGFQGDKFMASFNAVTSVGNHAAAAASAALSAVASVTNLRTPTGKALQITCGIASGPAMVGNMGTPALKRFTVFGHVVTTAGLLERLCKRYPGAQTLIGGVAVNDTKNFFELLTCDVVFLPNTNQGPRRTRIAALKGVSGGAADEWMYALENANQASRYADINEAFSYVIEGDNVNAAKVMEKVRENGDMSDPSLACTAELVTSLLATSVDGSKYANTLINFYGECMVSGLSATSN